ncbi:LTA synthase family protein [Chakrabartyella piscis]|uniref:LTA synthase family protein n=1 Tax=Chakrabartyella piscis TaxID=2918914 RepID=UPI0029586934|nr:LTA synthase family protein [Chakrabartyella piscis]
MSTNSNEPNKTNLKLLLHKLQYKIIAYKEHSALHQMKAECKEFFHKNIFTKLFVTLSVVIFPVFVTWMMHVLMLGSNENALLLFAREPGSIYLALTYVAIAYIGIWWTTTSITLSALLTSTFFFVFGLVDYFKYSILQEHFYPWDLHMAANANSFSEFLNALSFQQYIFEIIFSTLIYVVVLHFMAPRFPFKKWIYIPFGVACLGFLYAFTTDTQLRTYYDTKYNIAIDEDTTLGMLYEEYGAFSAFLMNLFALDLYEEPTEYGLDYMEFLFADYLPTGDETNNFQYPDIVVVLSEAYWDPTILTGVTFSEDPLQNYRMIAETNPSGSMVSPTFGGGTVRPEFEILSGMSTSCLPSGNIPYQQYIDEDIFSFARSYVDLGYDAVGLHTYQKTFYDRETAYPLMGFDEFLGEYDLHAEHHWNSGPYITDETIAEEIIYQLEQPRDVGVFIQAITMENHSMYYDKYDAKDRTIKVSGENLSEQQVLTLENFAAGNSNSDEALGVIYEYVMNREKPTIVLWYGDHLPTLGENFDPFTTTGDVQSSVASNWTDEEKLTMFSTPYIIFTNYDTGKEFRESAIVSPYFLSPLMADYMDAPATFYTNFLLEYHEVCTAASKYYGIYETTDSERQAEFMELHELLTYDMLIGEDYMWDIIYEGASSDDDAS